MSRLKFAKFEEYFKNKTRGWNFEKDLTLCLKIFKYSSIYAFTTYRTKLFLLLNGNNTSN